MWNTHEFTRFLQFNLSQKSLISINSQRLTEIVSVPVKL